MDPKALLDELMGKDRDLPLGQKRDSRLRFDDPQVCHYFLVSFCPHDLFPNTKSDLGRCGKVHDETLREPFLKSNKVAQYEAEFLRYLERLITDLERKIKRSYDRLEKEVPVMDHAPGGSERIANISNEVQVLIKRAEKEGEEGLVDQAQETMARVEILNKEKDLIMRTIMPEYGNILEKEKRMQVCEICGAMQASTDTEKRLASHLEGRQHVGYMKIRQMLEQLRKKRGEEQEAKKREREAQMLDAALDDKAIDGLKDSPIRKNGSYPPEKRQDKRMSSERNDRNRRRGGNDRNDRYHDRDNRYRSRHKEDNRGRDRRDKDWRGGGSRRRSRSRDRSRERSRDRSPEKTRERSRERSRERERERD